MADDIVLPGASAIVATDDIGSGRQVQLVKQVYGADGSATMVTAANGLPTAIGSTLLTGSASANSTDLIASTDASNYQMASITLSGTFSATVRLQGSNDNTNWFDLMLQEVSGSQIWSAYTATMNSATIVRVACIPTQYIRAHRLPAEYRVVGPGRAGPGREGTRVRHRAGPANGRGGGVTRLRPTDEMLQAYADASDPSADPDEQGMARIAAVLAIVERDYRITCGNISPIDGPNYCVKEPGHPGVHLGLSPSAARVWSAE
jgi:hypothetical protein